MNVSTGAASVWQSGRLLPSFPAPDSLTAYDLRSVTPELVLTLSSLAGLVNRSTEKVYLLQNSDDEFWFNEVFLSSSGTCVRESDIDLLDHLLKMYRGYVKGLIIYDPAFLDSRNVATTLAGLRDGLIVSPEQAEVLERFPHTLPVLYDLRKHHWRSRIQAYTWAYQNLFAECSSSFLAGINPGICGSLRSLLVAQRVFTCWLDARDFWPVPSQNWLSERQLFKRILENFEPGSIHLGWYISEPFGVRLASRAAMLTLASDHCTNLEIWSSLPAYHPVRLRDEQSAMEHVNTPVSGVASDEQAAVEAGEDVAVGQAISSAKRKVYLSFTISDGDNLQYCQHRLLRLWLDPARGKIPLGWTVAPALGQSMPGVAAFYARTASVQDEFIAGPSGGAYILPSYWPNSYLSVFLQLTGELMQSMQLSIIQMLDHSLWFGSQGFRSSTLQKACVEQLSPFGLRGVFSGAGTFFPSWHTNTGRPVYQNLGLAYSSRRTRYLIRRAAARGVMFINVYVFAWKLCPGDLLEVVAQLGEDFEVVTPSRLLELIAAHSDEKKGA